MTKASAVPVMRQPEKAVQADMVKFLRTIGASVYTLGTSRRSGDFPGTMQTPGIPDLWAFLPPARAAAHEERTGLWIEVKAVGGRRSPEQIAFGDSCKQSHVHYVCGGIDELVQWLIDKGWILAISASLGRRGRG